MNFIKRVSAPSLRPISLEEAAAHAHVSYPLSGDDAITIPIYLDAAIVACENILQTAIMDTRFELYSKRLCQKINLEKRWVSAINSVKYYDADEAQQTIDASNYTLQDFRDPNFLYFKNSYSFPTLFDTEFPVVVNYNAGATAASGVQGNIRDAVLLEFLDRNENRQTEVIGERIAAVMFSKTAEKILSPESLWL